MPNDDGAIRMLTLAVPEAALKVSCDVQASGVGAPAPALHGPALIATAQVDATCPKRRVTDPVAVTVCPSWAVRVNHTEVVCEWLTAGMKKKTTVKMAAKNLNIRSP